MSDAFDEAVRRFETAQPKIARLSGEIWEATASCRDGVATVELVAAAVDFGVRVAISAVGLDKAPFLLAAMAQDFHEAADTIAAGATNGADFAPGRAVH